MLCSAPLDSSIKTTRATMSSLNPLIVMHPSAPYTSATVGLQNDEVYVLNAIVKTNAQLVYVQLSVMGKDTTHYNVWFVLLSSSFP